MMYTISFCFEQTGKVYTTQPMTAGLAVDFIAEAINNRMIVTDVENLGGYRRAYAPH